MNSNFKTYGRTLPAGSTAMLLAWVLVASNAFADPQLRSETVKFQDLNVSTPAGVEALYSRIHAAAKRVCSAPDWEWYRELPCAKEAEATAIAKVNVPALTAFYRMKTGDHTETHVANR